MSAYTPGPWSVLHVLRPRANSETHPNMLLIVSKGADIAQVFQNTWDDTAQADAKLMAAAPELAAALRGLLSAHDAVTMGLERERNEGWIPKARAALAKAGAA